MANAQWTSTSAEDGAEGSSSLAPSAVKKPLKSCLKKTSSFPDLRNEAERRGLDMKDCGENQERRPRRSTSSAALGKPSLSPKRESLRRSRRRRQQRGEVNADMPKPKVLLKRANTGPPATMKYMAQPPPVKSILKRSTTDPSSMKKAAEQLRKQVSWTDLHSRWGSGGSNKDLPVLAKQQAKKTRRSSRSRGAPAKNYTWDGRITGLSKSYSAGSMSLLDLQKKRFPPGKPQRRGSGSPQSSLNIFQSSLDDLQSSLALDASCFAAPGKCKNWKAKSPARPCRRASIENTLTTPQAA